MDLAGGSAWLGRPADRIAQAGVSEKNLYIGGKIMPFNRRDVSKLGAGLVIGQGDFGDLRKGRDETGLGGNAAVIPAARQHRKRGLYTALAVDQDHRRLVGDRRPIGSLKSSPKPGDFFCGKRLEC